MSSVEETSDLLFALIRALMELWEARLMLSDLGQSNQAAVSELSKLQLKMDRVEWSLQRAGSLSISN